MASAPSGGHEMTTIIVMTVIRIVITVTIITTTVGYSLRGDASDSTRGHACALVHLASALLLVF